MRRIRVIPTLLLNSSGGLVKTVKFGKRTYIGDPINAVKIFNDKGVDELILLDIDASRDGREPNYALIEDIASEAFMPVGYGGGITTVKHMQTLFRCGIEKIVISTAAMETPQVVREASDQFGSQSVVVCLDVKKTLWKNYRVTSRSGTVKSKLDPVMAAKSAEALGAGEIIVYAIDRDGTYGGYDSILMKSLTSEVAIPVVACGGASRIDDFYNIVAGSFCSAVSAGSLFVYQRQQRGVLINYPSESDLIEHLYKKLN